MCYQDEASVAGSKGSHVSMMGGGRKTAVKEHHQPRDAPGDATYLECLHKMHSSRRNQWLGREGVQECGQHVTQRSASRDTR